MWRFRRRAFTASRANAAIWMRPPPTTAASSPPRSRSEEHTSELQSRLHLVCRLLLEKKKKKSHNLTMQRTTTVIIYRKHITESDVNHLKINHKLIVILVHVRIHMYVLQKYKRRFEYR